MIEDEAKRKWCPMIRKELACKGAINIWDNGLDVDENFKCIASNCMMWRWTQERGCYVETEIEIPIAGYCGLGGKP